MRKIALLVLLVAACGGDSGPTGTSAFNLTGTFIGSYTATLQPGTVFEGVFQLTQNGNNVTGTMTTNAGRSGALAASLSGTRLTGTITFTDGCNGTAQTTADITNGGTRMAGNYTANDCTGQYSGGYLVIKQ